ncbi:MAG: DUF362 domain-containing protein [Chitinivibrionales bacterium]|nr:DUF362 domain-containing protein [Chitinivibrionales bacterium]
MKKIKRRDFMKNTVTAAAGLSALSHCNSRIVEPDIRLPSKPLGLAVTLEYTDQTAKAKISWKQHDGSDITGAPQKKEIKGYHVYCRKNDSPSPVKINSQLISETVFTDSQGPEGNGFELGASYTYSITALDTHENESPHSNAFTLRAKKPSVVHKITNANAGAITNGALRLDAAIVKTMVHEGVKKLTEKQTIGEAFESLFPRITTETIIAIKINTLAGLSSHPEVVRAIVDGLAAMQNNTFPKKNIVVFDDRTSQKMASAGFVLQEPVDDYQVISTYGETNAKGEKNWMDTAQNINGSMQRFSTIVQKAEYIINVPVLKDHDQAGITFAMKNFFGIISAPGNMHGTMCDPYVTLVYSHPLVCNKVKLIVGDAIGGVHNRGPASSATFLFQSILLSTDPVAIDTYALSVINKQRSASNPPLKEIGFVNTGNSNHKDAIHIETADTYNLGSKNVRLIETIL